MRYYLLEPETPGDFGAHAVIRNRQERPLHVTKMHYEFETWPEDDLLEALGEYVGTKRLQRKLEALDPPVTGIEFEDCEISWDEQFEELYGDRQLPKYVWFRVTGEASKADFGKSENVRLVVSERVYNVMQQFSYRNCDVEDYDPSALNPAP